MKPLNLILGCLILAAFLAPLFAAALRTTSVPNLGSLSSIRRAFGLHSGVLRVNAITDGTHPTGRLGHLKADAAQSTRHLVVKSGSDADHFAVGTAADEPLGICADEPSAAEEPATVALFGVTPGTLLGVASEEITAGQDVYCAANGKLQNRPAVAGSYWKVGKAITGASGDGVQFEFAHHRPVRVSILANNAVLADVIAAATSPSELMFLGA